MTNTKRIKLELDIDELNTILEALGALPFARVYELIHAIQQQAQAQLQPATTESKTSDE